MLMISLNLADSNQYDTEYIWIIVFPFVLLFAQKKRGECLLGSLSDTRTHD